MERILTGLVILIMVLSVLHGYRKGLLRCIFSLVSFFAAVALVVVLSPYVTDWLQNSTPVSHYVQEACTGLIERRVETLKEQKKQELLSSYQEQLTAQYGSALSPELEAQLSAAYDSQASAYIQENGAEWIREVLNRLPVTQQFRISLDAAAGSAAATEQSMTEYAGSYLAGAVTRILGAILTFVCVEIILRLILWCLDLLGAIPGLHAVNKAGGAAAGLLQGLVILWILSCLLTLLSATDLGSEMLAAVKSNIFLNFLYQKNLSLMNLLHIW